MQGAGSAADGGDRDGQALFAAALHWQTLVTAQGRGLALRWRENVVGVMRLSISEMRQIATAVAADLDAAVSVGGITMTEGGSEHAEVFVVLEGCHPEPCRVLLNVPRIDSADFEHTLRSKLHEAISTHL